MSRGIRAEVVINDDTKISDIRKLQDRFAQLDGVATSYDLRSDPPKISLMLRDPQHLSVEGVPAGTHEFAHGWIMALNVQYITNLLGYAVEWEEVEIEHGRIKSVKGSFQSTVMAIKGLDVYGSSES